MEQKKCRICEQVKLLTEEFWHRREGSADGFRTECRECIRLKQSKYNKNPKRKRIRAERERKLRATDPKWVAKQAAGIRDWRKRHPEWRQQYESQPHVKKAKSEAYRRWREKDDGEWARNRWATNVQYREDVKRWARERRANPVLGEKIRIYHRGYYEDNLDHLREIKREASRKARIDPTKRIKMRRATKAWEQAHPEMVRVKNHRRRTRLKSAEGWFTVEDVKRIEQKQNGVCFYCDVSISGKTTIDHFIPLTRGGSNWPDNIRLACSSCNSSKGNKLPEEFTPKVKRYD